MDAVHFEKSDIQSFMLQVDDGIRRVAQFSAFPQRYIAGVDPTRKVIDAPTLDRNSIWHIPSDLTIRTLGEIVEEFDLNKKETTTMIEKKNFVTPPVKTPAGSLAHRHLGSLVTITLPSGAEITDILVGVRSGVPQRHGGDVADKDVVLYLQNVGVGYDPNYMRDLNGEFPLDAKSVVLVRRPKVVKTRAPKR